MFIYIVNHVEGYNDLQQFKNKCYCRITVVFEKSTEPIFKAIHMWSDILIYNVFPGFHFL